MQMSREGSGEKERTRKSLVAFIVLKEAKKGRGGKREKEKEREKEEKRKREKEKRAKARPSEGCALCLSLYNE